MSSSFHMLESFIRSKQGTALDTCEDAWFVSSHYACVMDGATSATGRRWTDQNFTGGQWAVQVLKQAIEELSKSVEDESSIDNASSLSPRQIVDFLTLKLHQAYEQEPGALEVMARDPSERSTASLILYQAATRTLMWVGDCQCAMLDEHGTMFQHIQPEKYIDSVTSRARAMYLQATRMQHEDQQADNADAESNESSNTETDPGRNFIRPLLKLGRSFQNNPQAPVPYRYYVMDGFPIADEGIGTCEIPPHVQEIILATDGYPKLYPTLQETEFHLKQLIQKDPQLIGRCEDHFMSTKGVQPGNESYDDRTYLRLHIGTLTETRAELR